MRRITAAALVLILSCTLTGCSLSLPPPDPYTLLGVFSGSFTCGFSGYDGAPAPIRAALVRTGDGDTLTVTGSTTTAVFRAEGGTVVLQTRGNESNPPLSLPLPTGTDCGAAAFLPLFSVIPDDTFTAAPCEGGILVSNADGSYTAVFTAEGIPARITCGGRTAVIESFTVTEPPTA